MSVSDVIKGLLAMSGKKQAELTSVLGMSSNQAVNNKIRKNSWFASDLLKVAELCGCKLAFVMPDGQCIYLSDDKQKKKKDQPPANIVMLAAVPLVRG